MHRLHVSSLLIALLPLCAFAQGLPHHGETHADEATALELERTVIKTTEIQGGCQQLEAIRIEPIPSDFDEEHKYNGFLLELWTAIGCNKEFPIWVAWRAAPPSGGVTQFAGLYKWHYKPPN